MVELMIVLIILGVLSSIAVPTYFEHVRESRRADATANISRVLGQQELFYGNNGSNYASSASQLGYASGSLPANTFDTEEGHYRIAMQDCAGGAIDDTDECIRLVATALSGSQTKDANCQTFVIDSYGARSSTKSGGSSSSGCWN